LEAVRRYYEWQLIGPHDAVALGAFIDDRLVGFCFGGTFRGALSGFLQKNRSFLAWHIVKHPWLVMNPLIREKVTNALKLLKKKQANHEIPLSLVQETSERSFGILSIAVEPKHHGLGIGKLLMKQAEHHARELGFTKMNLTVQPNNTQAIYFYERIGWVKTPQDGAWNGSMRKLQV
jgi:ribosomal protein S18 acetylase RimI-like enzyme